jgi:hypothetical protein
MPELVCRDQSTDSESPASPAIGWLQAGIRFALELVMLGALGYWGWSLSSSSVVGAVLAIGIPVAVAALWVIFRPPGDRSAGKASIIAVPGKIRLLIEIGLFALVIYGAWTAGSRAAGETLLTVSALHYALTWHRVRWLLAT